MSVRHAILGFLSWKPFTGYELKRLLSDALSSHWSGSNNQVYGTLVQLHRDGAVDLEVQPQEKLPARKVYTLTDKGKKELKDWMLSEPELPAVRSEFSTRLTWAASLTRTELMSMIASYRGLLEGQIAMFGELRRRGRETEARAPLEAVLWEKVEDHALAFYEGELRWIVELEGELGAKDRARGG